MGGHHHRSQSCVLVMMVIQIAYTGASIAITLPYATKKYDSEYMDPKDGIGHGAGEAK